MTAQGGFGIVVLLVWCVVVVQNVAVAEENNNNSGCPEGDCKILSLDNNNNNSDNEDLQIVALHTSQPVPKPKALNMMMMAEDQDESNFRPTPLPLTTSPISNSSLSKTNSTKSNITSSVSLPEEPRGRALNFTLHETQNANNNLANSSKHDEFDLSDVSINDDDDMDEMIVPRILVPHTTTEEKTTEKSDHNVTKGVCEKGGLTYDNGEKLEIGCDSICTCVNGKMDCEDRCSRPFIRKGKRIDDPLCSEKDTEDPCCAIMVCAGDTETEPLEMCHFGNKTYNRGDTFNKDCSEVCVCEAAGKLGCKARCPQSAKTSDSCVEIPDPNDSCCKKVLCDVTLDDHQDHEKDEMGKPTNKHKIVSATQANSTVILLDIEPKYEDDDANLPIVEVSNDKEEWNYYQLFPKGELFVREHFKYVRLENTEETIEVKQIEETGDKINRVSKDVIKDKGEPNKKKASIIKEDAKSCEYKGNTFKINEEHNDGCESLCKCHSDGEMKCLKLECPTYFGVDVLDPACVEWETIPPNFEPLAPNCCPEQVKCKNNGSCMHEGRSFKNWEQLPINVTGCEKRCYCELGKVECQNTCPPVPALPPANLPCPPREASLQHSADDDCCMYWTCSDSKDQAAVVAPTTNKTTKPDKIGPNNFNPGPFFHTKTPSKILGPLSVYANEDATSLNNDLDPLDRPRMPHINPEENPFVRNPTKAPTKFVGALAPKKPSATSATRQNSIPPKTPPQPTEHQISIHGQGDNPEDLLQFLQQHPEISNLPSGSVLEIHNLPTNINDINPNLNSIHKPPYVPILTHPEQGGHVPQDVSLQQILEELHKNVAPQGHNPLVPFPHSPPYMGHRDQAASGSKTANKTAGVRPHRPQEAFNNHYPDDFGFNQPRDDITVHALEAVDPHTIRLAFMVPPVIVGLHGRVEVRYTFKDIEDVSAWDLQVFAPPNDLIATPSLEFDLLDLVADKEYKIKITITLRDLHNTPSSKIYKIKTPKTETTTLPPQIPIEPDLEISDINSTWVTIVWRKFTENELQFIDGVQLRFREIDGKIYTATPLIHRAVTTFTIENLKPNTKYEIGIFFIPFAGQRTELHAEHMIQFTTANLVDTYGFSVVLDVSQVKSTSVEIIWSGVPYPEDKYVNIYRAIYQSDSGKEDQSTFKIAKRDSPTKTIITDLKPGTRYRLWLEVYLTNGKIKTSNVQDFITKPRAAPALGASSQDKVSRAEFIDSPRGDYYGPLVIVAILAAIAILSTLILLLILVRRHNQNKAAITPPSTRISQSAYDNPTYKVEIQQETMGL